MEFQPESPGQLLRLRLLLRDLEPDELRPLDELRLLDDDTLARLDEDELDRLLMRLCEFERLELFRLILPRLTEEDLDRFDRIIEFERLLERFKSRLIRFLLLSGVRSIRCLLCCSIRFGMRWRE